MKTKLYLSALLLAAVFASACTREILDPEKETAPVAVNDESCILVPFTAEAGAPETRVAVSGSTANIVFSAGDQLMVYNSLMAEPAILTMVSGAGQPSAVFTGNLVLKSGKTEADLAGKTIGAILIPKTGVEEGVFNYDSSTKKLTVDYSSKSLDTNLEALVNRTILYKGETRYEDKRFTFEMMTSYVKMNVTVPSEESDLAREYTVAVQPNIMISNKCVTSDVWSWNYSDYCAGVMTGTFTASSATSGTLYMALLAHRDVRLEIDDFTTDEPTFDISMENAYKEYGLLGGSIRGQVILPGKGYAKSITLTDPSNEDVLLGQPTSVRNKILNSYHADKNGNGYLSKYEAAQLQSCKMYGNTDLTDASFYQYFTGMTTLEVEALINCSNMTKVVLPKHITGIEASAFQSCTKLESVYIPSGVTHIGDRAFNSCHSLSRIVIPSAVTTIVDYAFRYCIGMTEVVFETPAQLASIGKGAFSYCTSLESFAIPGSNITAIADETFEDCTSLERVTMPSSIRSIGASAFRRCTVLNNVILPTQVRSIGESAFKLCTGLKTIRMPNRLDAIADELFNGCTSLTGVTMAQTVTSIGDRAFKECDALTILSIPAAVTSIGYEAIYNCDNLTTIYCYPTTPPSVSYYSIWGNPKLTTIYVPDKDAYWAAQDTWSQYWWNKIVEM